jgi:hypothetical protein
MLHLLQEYVLPAYLLWPRHPHIWTKLLLAACGWSPVRTVIQRVLLPSGVCCLTFANQGREQTGRTHSLHHAGLCATRVIDSTRSNHTQSPPHGSHTTLAYEETLSALSCRLTHPSSLLASHTSHTPGQHCRVPAFASPSLSRLLTNHSCCLLAWLQAPWGEPAAPLLLAGWGEAPWLQAQVP